MHRASAPPNPSLPPAPRPPHLLFLLAPYPNRSARRRQAKHIFQRDSLITSELDILLRDSPSGAAAPLPNTVHKSTASLSRLQNAIRFPVQSLTVLLSAPGASPKQQSGPKLPKLPGAQQAALITCDPMKLQPIACVARPSPPPAPSTPTKNKTFSIPSIINATA